MADETRPSAPVEATVTPARARADAAAADTPARRDRAETRLIQLGGRESGDTSRTSPRMRFDVLQIAAWLVGLYLIVAGLVAIARAGFDDLALFEPVVQVGNQSASPLYALLWLLVGTVVLTAGTGSVDERRLRILGVLLGIIGAVFLIESAAFTDYLGVDGDSGGLLLAFGALLVAASFVPPLSIVRPGVPKG